MRTDSFGSIYHGQVDDQGRRHGFGMYQVKSSSLVEGYFENEELNGLGRKLKYNGELQVGSFKCGNLDGLGKHVSPSGTVWEGEFVDNRFKR